MLDADKSIGAIFELIPDNVFTSLDLSKTKTDYSKTDTVGGQIIVSGVNLEGKQVLSANELEYTSSNPKFLTVDANGKVTIVNTGDHTGFSIVTAKYTNSDDTIVEGKVIIHVYRDHMKKQDFENYTFTPPHAVEITNNVRSELKAIGVQQGTGFYGVDLDTSTDISQRFPSAVAEVWFYDNGEMANSQVGVSFSAFNKHKPSADAPEVAFPETFAIRVGALTNNATYYGYHNDPKGRANVGPGAIDLRETPQAGTGYLGNATNINTLLNGVDGRPTMLRSEGWHQVVAIVDGGLTFDNVGTSNGTITLYLDGVEIFTENYVPLNLHKARGQRSFAAGSSHYAIFDDMLMYRLHSYAGEVIEYTLTKEATTNGTIAFDPAKDTYVAGEIVTVTAIPESGYRFVSFTGASTSTTNPVTITMDADKTIGAIFEPIPVLNAKGVIDRPATAATVSGTTAITGWFLDGVAVESIEVLINGNVVGEAQYGIARNDVANAYPEYNNSNAGFHYALNTTALANGSYTLSVKVTDVNGGVKTLPARTLVIANVMKAFGTIDRPYLGAEISGRAAVTGWFLNDKGVEKVEVLMNGAVVGEATYGITRNDVAAAYPLYNISAAGYQYILDTATLTNGEYTLTIEVTDLEGTKTTVANRTVTVNNVLSSIGTIDSPSNNAQVNGTVVVRGWYLDPNGVEKIEVLVDEDVMGEAVYGITRNDVFAVYGAYNNTQSGYYYMLDTTTLINGGYTLTVKVTDTLGNVKTLTRSIVVMN